MYKAHIFPHEIKSKQISAVKQLQNAIAQVQSIRQPRPRMPFVLLVSIVNV
jgi:hypothetical protein